MGARSSRTFELAQRDDNTTPKCHVEQALVELENHADLQPIVLYTCGSLCPIHRQHVHIQELAKAHLEITHPDLRVVGGFIASSNDLYVENKYRMSVDKYASFLPWETRATLIDLALAGHEFIVQDRWDGKPQPEFQEYFMAHANLQEHLDSWCAVKGLRSVKVLAVYGADLVEKCQIATWYPSMGLGLICAERPGYSMPRINPEQQRQRETYLLSLPPEFVERFGRADISSTAVQQLMRRGTGSATEQGLTVQDMLHPAVEAELRSIWRISSRELPMPANTPETGEPPLGATAEASNTLPGEGET